jgi:hypothetical protein
MNNIKQLKSAEKKQITTTRRRRTTTYTSLKNSTTIASQNENILIDKQTRHVLDTMHLMKSNQNICCFIRNKFPLTDVVVVYIFFCCSCCCLFIINLLFKFKAESRSALDAIYTNGQLNEWQKKIYECTWLYTQLCGMSIMCFLINCNDM